MSVPEIYKRFFYWSLKPRNLGTVTLPLLNRGLFFPLHPFSLHTLKLHRR